MPAAKNRAGYFGPYGGVFVPETLMPAVEQLRMHFNSIKHDRTFNRKFQTMLKEYVGRPTPLTLAENLSAEYGCQIYLKREDLAHTGAHKINNALGQALLAKTMGKRRLIAETGAGQHGVATAAAGAKFGLKTEVYMGTKDMERQRLNVRRMEFFGARVIPVASGSQTLKDAINEALRDWAASFEDTHYLLGSVLGPHPYPDMIAHFQSVIGREARRQILQREGRLPDKIVACVGGGSNAIGIFRVFLAYPQIELIGVEAGGTGLQTGRHASRLSNAKTSRPGIIHGTLTYVLQDKFGQIMPTHSVAAGLDYPAVGPEHAALRELGRVSYTVATDEQALHAFRILSEKEGIMPALESAHAVYCALELAKRAKKHAIILINLSGRGDKDLDEAREVR